MVKGGKHGGAKWGLWWTFSGSNEDLFGNPYTRIFRKLKMPKERKWVLDKEI